MLTISRLRSAQRNFRLFLGFNVISFSFMTGNIIFLYAIRLGADNRLIGFLSALSSITFMFSLVGRRVIRRLGVVRTKGYFWLSRYLIMTPVLLTLLPAVRDSAPLSLGIVTLGYFGFNFLKGIGLAADKPIMGYISRASDRASFLAGNNMITFIGQIVTGLAMAFLLGKASPLYMYVIFISVGIVSGFFAAWFTLQLPEPELEAPMEKVSLVGSIREAAKRPEFSRLIFLVMLSNIGTGMALGFVVVYAKTVYQQPDNFVVFFTVAGAVGALCMAALSRFLTDRIGSKPMYFAFNILRLMFLAPVIWAPSFLGPAERILFLGVVFFFERMTFWGINSTADLYFFATTRARDRLDLGIVFNITRGLFGMIGSFGGGFLLSWLQGVYGPEAVIPPFQIYFTVSALFFIANLLLIGGLPDVSDYSITDLLSIIFSPSNLKAIYYLNKLEKSTTSEEEREIVAAMGSAKSSITRQELRKRLESPSFFVRMEALSALNGFPPDERTLRLLMSEIGNHPFTTAHIAAGMLGDILKNGSRFSGSLRKEAVEVLTEALNSEDYLLKSKAALALAEMGIRDSQTAILSILASTDNPREIIYTVKSLELHQTLAALPLIFSRIGTQSYPHLTDDLILSAAGILGMGDWFYSHYSAFLRREQKGLTSLRAEIEESDAAPRLRELLQNFHQPGFAELFLQLTASFGSDGANEARRESLQLIESFTRTVPEPEALPHKTRFLFCAFLIFHSLPPRGGSPAAPDQGQGKRRR